MFMCFDSSAPADIAHCLAGVTVYLARVPAARFKRRFFVHHFFEFFVATHAQTTRRLGSLPLS